MVERNWIERVVFGVALVLLIAGAASGDWNGGSMHAALAAHVEHTAAAPLYGLVAAVANLIPVGEPMFRLAVLGAVLGAGTLAGVVAAARAIVPRDPAAAVIAAILVAVTPGFRDAASFATPAILAAFGVVWAIAWSIKPATPRTALAALAACAITIGAAPWLGLVVAIAVVIRLAKQGVSTGLLAVAVGGIGALVVVAWFGAIGRLPELRERTGELVAAIGGGAGVVVVGGGLLGIGFGAATGLTGTRWLAGMLAMAIAHAALAGDDVVPLAILGIAIAVIPAAIVRAATAPVGGGASDSLATRRHLVALVGGIPLVAAALLTGPAFTVDDAGASPARLADDLWSQMPPGPGVFVATRGGSWIALDYARDVAGARPDLAIVPRLRDDTDVAVADALRNERVAGADVPAFGRLDQRRALPRGRGFEMLGRPPDRAARIQPPADYRGAAGAEVSLGLALSRALYEADTGRLDAAARAAGLERRFKAADLAMMAVTVPTAARPALFGFVPRLDPPGTWILDLFGDDLAWVANLDPLVLGEDAPIARRLHAAWRQLWLGKITPTDAAITSLGPAAIAATTEMMNELHRQPPK